MNRRAISAFLIGCEPKELMAFADRDDHVGVVGPDGKKYIFTVAELEAGDKKMNPPKPKPKPKAKTPAKRRAPVKKPATKKGPAKP